MPELPEAERARQVLHDSTRGLIITQVETTVDEIIFVDLKEGEFESTLIGRSVVSAERKGKLFWLNLYGKGKHPVFHLGMTGMIQLKGAPPVLYQSRSSGSDEVWPPKFWKFIIHLSPIESTSILAPVQIAYLDPRRLGRIRLVQSPSTEPPVSLLGPDPILCPPTIDQLSTSLLKRKSPIKTVLLDQTVAAGVGNWVADEILYQSLIHPLTLSSNLTLPQITLLREKMISICTFAVGVQADSSRFPKEWLFGVRWGKGKGKGGDGKGVLLPDNSHAKVEFITIGGRTSAFVPSIQLPPSPTAAPTKLKSKAAPKPKLVASPLRPASTTTTTTTPTSSKPVGSRKRKLVAKEEEGIASVVGGEAGGDGEMGKKEKGVGVKEEEVGEEGEGLVGEEDGKKRKKRKKVKVEVESTEGGESKGGVGEVKSSVKKEQSKKKKRAKDELEEGGEVKSELKKEKRKRKRAKVELEGED